MEMSVTPIWSPLPAALPPRHSNIIIQIQRADSRVRRYRRSINNHTKMWTRTLLLSHPQWSLADTSHPPDLNPLPNQSLTAQANRKVTVRLIRTGHGTLLVTHSRPEVPTNDALFPEYLDHFQPACLATAR